MIFDSSTVPFSRVFIDHWQLIYAEYQAIRHRVFDWPESHLYEHGWKVFGLYDFPNGELLDNAEKDCPVTVDLVNRHIPGHGAVGFSLLQPNTVIQPHIGYQGSFLRLHLGLSVPEGDCGLKVGSHKTTWKTGEVIIFDDRNLHSAWNKTDTDRVVLLIDFPEKMREP